MLNLQMLPDKTESMIPKKFSYKRSQTIEKEDGLLHNFAQNQNDFYIWTMCFFVTNNTDDFEHFCWNQRFGFGEAN